MKVTWLTLLYAAAGMCFILADELLPGSLVTVITKAVLMPLLLLLYLSSRPRPAGLRNLVVLALVFSWMGDVALEFTAASENFFLAGLGSFMITQLLYVVLFAGDRKAEVRAVPVALALLPVVVYGIALVTWLSPALGPMRVPVTAYAVVIHAMLALAVVRALRRRDRSGWLVLAGAILFVLSDSMIAISRFKHPFGASAALIMATYLTGQFLIVSGLKRQHQR